MNCETLLCSLLLLHLVADCFCLIFLCKCLLLLVLGLDLILVQNVLELTWENSWVILEQVLVVGSIFLEKLLVELWCAHLRSSNAFSQLQAAHSLLSVINIVYRWSGQDLTWFIGAWYGVNLSENFTNWSWSLVGNSGSDLEEVVINLLVLNKFVILEMDWTSLGK